MHCLHEAVPFDGHDHVDGVEVALAAEAPGEVGVGVDGRIEVVAPGTHEAEPAIMGLVDDLEDIGDEGDDLDIVSQFAQVFLGQGVGQERLLSKAGAVQRRLRRR